METFEKTYGKYVVSFNNSNEYIDCGPLYDNPKFEGILIREKFSNKGVEFYGKEISSFYQRLRYSKNAYLQDSMEEYLRKFPLVTLVRDFTNDEFRSNFAIMISDYDGIRVKFFMGVSHQYNLSFDAIETRSPEFKLEEILEILIDANKLYQKEIKGE